MNKERARLIREGNKLFNEGKVKEALKIFLKTNYMDGIGRVADYYYDKKQLLTALKLYKKIGASTRVEEILIRMAIGLKYLIHGEKHHENNSN